MVVEGNYVFASDGVLNRRLTAVDMQPNAGPRFGPLPEHSINLRIRALWRVIIELSRYQELPSTLQRKHAFWTRTADWSIGLDPCTTPTELGWFDPADISISNASNLRFRAICSISHLRWFRKSSQLL